MKRTTLYQVDRSGHVSPIFSRSEEPRTRRVWRSWVNNLVGVVLMFGVMCVPGFLVQLVDWVLGGSK